MHTKDKLAAALRAILQEELAVRAENGEFDDFESDSPTPISDLAMELAALGTSEALDLRVRVVDGEFDATAEDDDAWSQSPGDEGGQ